MPKDDNETQQKKRTLNELRNKIFIKKPNKDFLIQAHHAFMISYGWIPLEDFKNMPVPMFLNLSEQLMKMSDEINKKGRS